MIETRDRRIVLPDSLCPSCAHSYFKCKCSLLDDEPFVPGTVKPEADYIEMQRLGKKLGIPAPMMNVRLESLDADGKLVDLYDERSRTFNRNFYNYVLSLLSNVPAGTGTFGAGFLAMKTTTATVQTFNFGGNGTGQQFSWVGNATVGTATKGIIVGTGTTAESFEHNTLVTPVAHGNAASQLSYTAQTVTTTSYNAGTKTWTTTMARILNNNSGGTIVVAETGIYVDAMSNPFTFMIARDLLGATVSVLNAGQLTVTYTFTLTFPA